MTSTTDMNIILGQGTAAKEVHNVKKQNLEINQQFVVQSAEEQKQKEKKKIHKAQHGDKIEIKSDQEDGKKEKKKGSKKKANKGKPEDESKLSEGSLIDITV